MSDEMTQEEAKDHVIRWLREKKKAPRGNPDMKIDAETVKWLLGLGDLDRAWSIVNELFAEGRLVEEPVQKPNRYNKPFVLPPDPDEEK